MERAIRSARRAALVLAGLMTLNTAAEAQRLQGFADMHTHPMVHLAFGGRIVYGAPEDNTFVLSHPRVIAPGVCRLDSAWVGDAFSGLNNCDPVHGSYGFFHNPCGDALRSAIVDQVEEDFRREFPNPGLPGTGINDHLHAGHPNYPSWPHWSSVTHQQMRIEWIRRARDGGLRVLVGLATNNSLLAKAADAREAVDDKASVELQLREMRRFANNNLDVLEVALTPAHLRTIVNSGRIALVLGVETDDFGNLTHRQAFDGEVITEASVEAELRRLRDVFLVRYILPLHFSDSVLGGYAINKQLFALSSKEYTNAFPEPEDSCGEGVHFELEKFDFSDTQAAALRSRGLSWVIDTQPDYTPPAETCGHRNSRGLQDLGHAAINRMMNLGLMIDIDHMSRRTADATLEIARTRDYPLNSGHNGPVAAECLAGGDPAALQHCNENARTATQYQRIREVGGMIGLGPGTRATAFVQTYRGVLEAAGNRPLAIGTDANGLYRLPEPDPLAPVPYSPSLPNLFFGPTRMWHFDGTATIPADGFAHYGMLPDYIGSWRTALDPALRMTNRSMDAFMSSAEGFARMWEKSARRATPPQFADISTNTGWCTHPGATLLTGDFNGDGSDDLLCRDTSHLWLDYADVRGQIQGWHDWDQDNAFCTHEGATLKLGDVDGDGRTDFICHDPGRIWIDRADTDGHFGTLDWWRDTAWCPAPGVVSVGDFNGDGRADLFCREAGGISIHYANAAGEYAATRWQLVTPWCAGNPLDLGDFNGDGRTDLLCRGMLALGIEYADVNGRFAVQDWFLNTTWCSGTAIRLGDFNGDGRTDLLCKGPTRMEADFATADGRFGDTNFRRDTTWCTAAGSSLLLTDINGDGRDDLLCRAGTTLQVDYAEWSGAFSR